MLLYKKLLLMTFGTTYVLKSKNCDILYDSHNLNLLGESTLHPCSLNHLWN